jgi:hypothetical protein
MYTRAKINWVAFWDRSREASAVTDGRVHNHKVHKFMLFGAVALVCLHVLETGLHNAFFLSGCEAGVLVLVLLFPTVGHTIESSL